MKRQKIFPCIILLSLATSVYSYEVWPDPMEDDESLIRPKTWDEKNLGQWCRNRTIGKHIRCPMGSAVHLYICCGEDGTDCCFRIQPIVIAYVGGLFVVLILSTIFGLLLKFNVIFPVTDTKNQLEYRDIPKDSV